MGIQNVLSLAIFRYMIFLGRKILWTGHICYEVWLMLSNNHMSYARLLYELQFIEFRLYTVWFYLNPVRHKDRMEALEKFSHNWYTDEW